MATMVTTMADLDMSKDFDYARYDRIVYEMRERHGAHLYIEIMN